VKKKGGGPWFDEERQRKERETAEKQERLDRLLTPLNRREIANRRDEETRPPHCLRRKNGG
jgi:hypothetical protein